MIVKEIVRKSMMIRPSGRSTDFIAPSFGYGCLYNCTYCYMKRHKPTGLDVAKNIHDILTEINSHVYFDTTEKPNQTHYKYITYDLGCNEDLALHAKYYDWEVIFDFFKNHELAMGSFATKYVNKKLLEYNPNKKIRIRFSLMPQVYADKLEPNTSSIIDRIHAINDFVEAGYDVHINFSPVIVVDNWLEQYELLFEQVDSIVKYKDQVMAEVIFLTHNKTKHDYNVMNNLPGEELLWFPELQETKISQYGGDNIRYNHLDKVHYINDFKTLHKKVIPWNTIRYIF
jgi:spore photoproduct lyase